MVLNSPTVMEILNDNGNNIQAYFKKHHPSEKDPYGISAKVSSVHSKLASNW